MGLAEDMVSDIGRAVVAVASVEVVEVAADIVADIMADNTLEAVAGISSIFYTTSSSFFHPAITFTI